MAREKDLQLALEMLTEGSTGPMAITEHLEAAAAETRKEHKSWTMGPGIQGLGIGEKITDATQTQELVLRVYVEKKKPESKLKGERKIPKEVKVEGLSTKLPTDVIEIGKVKVEPNTTRVRPAIPGFSCGHVNITAGTFGCLVRKKDDPTTLYILSNSHVLADEGVGAKGDKIIQPGDLDGGKAPTDVIAELSDWVPFTFTTTGYPNLVDAAIAKVKNKADVTSVIRLIGVPAGISTTVRRGMQVQKTGRTTDYTVGIIRDVNYRLALQYKKPGGGKGRVGLKDQVLCTRYTAGGDSGSAVLNMKKKVVGLHFAGSPSSSIFNRIQHVTQLLNIDIVTTKI